MPTTVKPEPLAAAIDEYIAVFSADWRPKTLEKYETEFRVFTRWLQAEKRPMTTASLDFQTLLAYVAFLKAKPAVRGIWRGNSAACENPSPANSRPRSLNSVGASMRSLRAFVLWLFEDGRLPSNPFARKNRRGGQNPLIPRADTPTKSATLSDLEALERGCAGRNAVDLRDQAMVSGLKTTSARNSSVRLLRVEDVDMQRNVITFERAKGDKTYQVALHPETKAAITRYLHRGRVRLLPRFPVRGLEDVPLGEDPGYLFIARDTGRVEGAGPLSANAVTEMLTRRYHAGGGTLPRFGSHRI